ncbi:MAG TPA: hypothetical protein PK542_09895 [Treponemataceae bacterium]|nr:hypothetical protein [Treponemataceae bacterium]
MAFVTTYAAPGDIDEIMRIEDASFAPTVREARETFIDRLSTRPACCTVLACDEPRDGRRLSGYLSAEVWDRVPEPTARAYGLGHRASERQVTEGTVLYISSFAVDPLSRGGVGRPFFRDSIGLIRSHYPTLERIAFIVHEDWLAARHIYEGEGFRYTGKIAGFFAPDHKSALVMERLI